MIDINVEHTLPLNEAAKVVPGRPHTATIWRWWRRGVKGVKLETVVVGGRRFTSVEAIQRFIASLSDPQPHHAPRPLLPDVDTRSRTRQRLDEAGF